MIFGTFETINKHIIEVVFNCGGEDIEIGVNKSIHFTDSPLTIKEEMDDTFDTIITRKCTINLLSSIYLGDYLFTKDDRGIGVSVTDQTTSEVLFRGYVQPLTFAQDYNSTFNSFTINCDDYLSTLQNRQYKQNNKYDENVANAVNVTFGTLINGVLGNNYPIYYDGAIQVEDSTNTVFQDLSINELLFLGDDEDGVWTEEEILSEILQYLNLHIRWYDDAYYIYNDDTIKRNNSVRWVNIINGTLNKKTIPTKTITQEDYASEDTNLSIADTYNQIKVKCNLKEIDTVISNPLDDDSLYSPYTNKQLYAKLFYSNGGGDGAKVGLMDLIQTGKSTNQDTYTEEYLIQRYLSNTWKFNADEVIEKDTNGKAINQHKIMEYLKTNPCKTAIISIGTAGQRKQGDNEPTSKVEMKKSLILSICGNGNQTENGAMPNATTLQANSPIATYNGSKAGGIFSPIDDKTTNYLVFSGDFILKSKYEMSGIYGTLKNMTAVAAMNAIKPQKFKGDVGCSTFAYYRQYDPTFAQNVYEGTDDFFIQPYVSDFSGESDNDNHGGVADNGIKKLRYKYSAMWDNTTDTFDKLPVLLCEMKIGDKWAIEWDDNGNFTPNQFRWVTEAQIPIKDGVRLNTFTLGCNPKLNDFIINQQHHIANTLEYNQNVDASGTAIPIKASDQLSGDISFKIIAPFNAIWDTVTRVHPTAFRHTQWATTSRYILPYLEYIQITAFECKLYTDNGGYNNTITKDLVYISNEVQGNYNIKDGIEFKINTALNSDEANAKGISTNPKLSNPTYNSTPLMSLKSTITNDTGKAEELYIDEKWREYQTPRIILETTVHSDTITGNPFIKYKVSTNYQFNGDKTFMVIKSEIDPKMNRNTITIKETNQ